jgi:hypothetical protein
MWTPEELARMAAQREAFVPTRPVRAAEGDWSRRGRPLSLEFCQNIGTR